jgi:hypothetical protein
MSPEKSFWEFLRPKLTGHVTRFENAVGVGMPDVNIVQNGAEFWLELKAQEGEVLIRKEQRVWGLKHSMSGGVVFVISHDFSVDLIKVFRHPLDTVKHNNKYQRIVSDPIMVFKKNESKELIEFIYANSLRSSGIRP